MMMMTHELGWHKEKEWSKLGVDRIPLAVLGPDSESRRTSFADTKWPLGSVVSEAFVYRSSVCDYVGILFTCSFSAPIVSWYNAPRSWSLSNRVRATRSAVDRSQKLLEGSYRSKRCIGVLPKQQRLFERTCWRIEGGVAV
jgi:hypothetical protein